MTTLFTPQNAPLSYLATPYTNYPGGITEAYVAAARLAAKLINAGIKIYSPICHCHPIAIYGGLAGLAHEQWLRFDESMMRVADVLIVAHMPSWQESKGIAAEIAFFGEAGKPIFDCEPKSLRLTKWSGK